MTILTRESLERVLGRLDEAARGEVPVGAVVVALGPILYFGTGRHRLPREAGPM